MFYSTSGGSSSTFIKIIAELYSMGSSMMGGYYGAGRATASLNFVIAHEKKSFVGDRDYPGIIRAIMGVGVATSVVRFTIRKIC
jgi:hypothetical protein